MSYYPDFHPATLLGAGDRLRAIGWLHPDHEFSHGAVPDDLLATLKEHIGSAFQPCAFGGWHDCEFCDNCKGYSNLVVPTRDAVYVAPEMIVHYITDHGYRPQGRRIYFRVFRSTRTTRVLFECWQVLSRKWAGNR